ncbi:MAG: hypothetical protein HFI39_08055 [Lachnospiraceae bacterium]|nr:hypothetical protein [Lachnospiraceae bacterium]
MAGERVRYICPICDQELKFGKHYCWNCKSRVEEPWRYTGGHLPNEGHADGCHPAQTYMQPRTSNPANTGRTHGGRSLAGKNNTSKQYTYNRPGTAPNAARTAVPGGASAAGGAPYRNPGAGSYGGSGTYGSNTPRRKNTGVGTLILVLLVFWFIIQLVFGILFRF